MSDSRDPGSHDRHFRTDHLLRDLRGRAVRSGAVTVGSQTLRFGIRLGSTAVLARLLVPDDFGLLAMVAAVTGFVGLFRDLGLSMATIQRAEIDQSQVSVLFWINLGLSILLMGLVVLAAPAIAAFYRAPEVTQVTVVLAFGFVFGGLSVQHQALLRRQMRFTALATIEVASLLVSVATAIAAAFAGLGYWSLVAMRLAEGVASAAGLWIVCDWRPSRPARAGDVRAMLGFGGNLTGFRILNYFSRNLDNILIGRFAGSQQLGFYDRAYQLLLLPIRQVNRPIAAVAIPTLSALQQDAARYRRYYERALNVIAYLTLPAVLTLVVLADEVIRLMLGEQWLEAAVIFRVLAVAALFQPLMNTSGWIFVSRGRTDRMLRWGMVSAPCFVASFAIGMPWGALGVAAAYAVCSNLLMVPLVPYLVHGTPLTARGLFSAVWRPLVLASLAFAAELVAHGALASWSLLPRCAATASAGLGAAAASLLVWPKARSEILGLGEMLRSLRSKRRGGGRLSAAATASEAP